MWRSMHCLYAFVLLPFVFGSSWSFEVRADASLHRCDSSKKIANISAEIIHRVRSCRHKLHLQITAINSGKTPEEVEYVFVEDALDDKTGITLKLLNPLVVRFRQEQVLLAYPLRYLSAVNARASEVIINYQNKKNFTGCDDESQIKPTCGLKHGPNGPVEYSQGFCCFCPDTPVNKKHTRGGQDCSLKTAPSKIDLAAYKASAHCLKKSGIWYTVNALEKPIIIHQVFIRVFALHTFPNGSSGWISLSGDDDFSLGIQNPYQFDDEKTIAMTYVTQMVSKDAITIKYEEDRLLIPQPLLDVGPEDYPPPLKRGPGDYLIMNKSLINPDGDACDTAGVSYEAFSLQKTRCDVPAKTCLKNQPWDFWEQEDARRTSGSKGKHLLQYYGTPFKDPIIMNKETGEHWLAMEYYKTHRTVIFVEVKADDIVALKPGKHSQILTVMSVAQPDIIYFHVTVHNSGLASAMFSVQILGCSFNVPSSLVETRVVAAQLKEEFVLSTKPANIQLEEKFTCSVHVNNSLYGMVAKRKVVVKPKSRCVCHLHCKCACLGESLKCVPMAIVDYHAAGFKGSLPILTARPPYRAWAARHPWITLLALILVMLLFGAIKGTIGFAGYDKIGEMGYKYALYKPGKIEKYPDADLETCEVVYDDSGYPLHPDTRKRLKMFKPSKLFLLNLFICFIYPFFYLWLLFHKEKKASYSLQDRTNSHINEELSKALDEAFEALDDDSYEEPSTTHGYKIRPVTSLRSGRLAAAEFLNVLKERKKPRRDRILKRTSPRTMVIPSDDDTKEGSLKQTYPRIVVTPPGDDTHEGAVKLRPPGIVVTHPDDDAKADQSASSKDALDKRKRYGYYASHAEDQDRYRYSYGFHRDDALTYETVPRDSDGLEKFREKATMAQHIVH